MNPPMHHALQAANAAWDLAARRVAKSSDIPGYAKDMLPTRFDCPDHRKLGEERGIRVFAKFDTAEKKGGWGVCAHRCASEC